MLEMNFGRTEWIIMSLMEKVRKFAPVKEDRLETFISLSNSVNNMVTTMENINGSSYLNNPELISTLVEKLPAIHKYNWAKYRRHLELQKLHITLKDFATWLEEEADLMAGIKNPFDRNKTSCKKENVLLTDKKHARPVHPSTSSTGCNFCKDDKHNIQECGVFLEKPIEQRRDAVLALKLCFLCLKAGHVAQRCFRKKRCGENGCKGKHDKLLHLDKKPDQQRPEERQPAEQFSLDSNFCGNLTKEGNETALLRIAPVKIRGPSSEIETFALFDEGSTCSMVDEDVAEKLGLAGPELPLCFQWTNGIVHFENNSKVVSLDISSAFNPTYYKMNGVRTVKTLKLPAQNIDFEEICQKFPYLDSTILNSIKHAVPQILIGQDNYGLIVPRQIIQPDLKAPVMGKSRLGWTISGSVNLNKNSSKHINLCCQHLQDLHILVKDSFKLESFGLKPDSIVKSVEDRKAVDIMERTLTRTGDRFEIGHLWRDEGASLPDSYLNAYSRLLCMERKMNKDPDFAAQYCQKIEDYVSKKYATKLSLPEAAATSKKTWYLPHFAVWHAKKKGSLRLVFDAACRSEGKSLNDFLLQGPDYVPSLVTVLWRFRQGKIAFSGDVKEMFHQVVIRQEDRCAQRFLFRGMERNRDPDVYQMDVLIFGAVSSPSVAQFVKNKNASKFEKDFPGITRCMEKQHYVDDYLDSCFYEEDAVKRVADVIFVHKKAGFQMVKWITNSEEVLRSIPKELRSSQSQIRIDSENIERVLGLCWFPKCDEFIFSLNYEKVPSELKVPTKREILRFVMSIFDPLGFLGPVIIQARILMQEIWRLSIDWDTSIPDDIFVKWQKWLLDLKEIMPVKIPRYYFPSLPYVSEVTLHIFSDASEKAYSSVAYIVSGFPGNTQVSFVGSKFKVAPLKQQTIPKLELQGAVLSCRLGKAICNEIEYKVDKVFYWTDSMIVLKQIRSQSRRFPTFVACRIGEIQEESDISQWRWVPSELNVADKATKEGKHFDLDIWLQGPEFLRSSADFWPKEPELECKDVVCVVAGNPDKMFVLPDVNRFSNWFRLIRSTGWILKFRDALLSQVSLKSQRSGKCQVSKQKLLILEIRFIDEASVLWIKWSQYTSFEEISLLSKDKCLPKSSRIFKLSPFIDQDGILRLKGRFPDSNNLNLSYNSRFPIILDPRNKYTELLIDYYHRQAGHVGVETVISNLRTKYWILHIRSAVKRIFSKCQFCKIRNCKPVIPEMGFLPSVRLEENVFPFTYVGIDLFGPMNVSVGRRTEKRYGAMFTCLTIRAIHIELVASLEASSTIMAIRRFCCRRGHPKEIWTDNGTNFIGADRELKDWFRSLDHQRISDSLSVHGIQWRFNCPLAPNMAGVWERMIKSVKRSLKVTLNTVKPKEEVLVTLLLEAEYMINSRPLTHISVDPSDPEAVTPNHFLLLRPGGVRSSGPNALVTKKQWIFSQALADLFWKRWVQQYRPNLINRQKWHGQNTPIKISDVVVIVDEKAPRNEWLLGKIEEVYPGKDGVVRVAKLTTSKGTYTRPVSKLCVLPVS